MQHIKAKTYKLRVLRSFKNHYSIYYYFLNQMIYSFLFINKTYKYNRIGYNDMCSPNFLSTKYKWSWNFLRGFHMNKYLAFQNEIVYFKEINKY